MDYICAHREPVKLLLCRAEGTSYEHFVHNMVVAEVEYTQRYMEVLRRLGRDIPVLDKSLCHIIASGMFNGIFEIVVHDMPVSYTHLGVGAGGRPGGGPARRALCKPLGPAGPGGGRGPGPRCV